MINLKDIPRSPGVYRLKAPDTDEMYVGSSVNVYDRMTVHSSRLKRGVHDNSNLQKAYNRLNGNLVAEVQVLPTKKEALEVEQRILDDFSQSNLLFNIAKDVRAPQKGRSREFSDTHRKKLSEASKGVPKSEDHRASLSRAKLGTTQDPEVVQKRTEKLYCPVLIEGTEYPSLKHAAEALGLSDSTVSRRVANPSFQQWKKVVPNGAT